MIGGFVVAGLVSVISSLVTAAIGWMTDFVTAVSSDVTGILPLFVVAVPMVGLGVGLLRRLINVN